MNIAGMPLEVMLVASVRLFPRIMTAAPHLAGCGQCFYEGPQRHTQTEDHAIGLGPAISCRAIEVSVGGLQQSGVRVCAQPGWEQKLWSAVSVPAGVILKTVPQPLSQRAEKAGS